MKINSKKIIALILCLSMLFSFSSVCVNASQEQEVKQSVSEKLTKGFYEMLNKTAETLVKIICTLYPNPRTWEKMENYNSEEIGFMAGRETYATAPLDGNAWSLGFADRSIIPDDVNDEKYNIGRDLTNRIAKGVYDDQKIRVTAIDDLSGEGIVILGAIDAMGITSTDVRSIRKIVLESAKAMGIKIASINICATHSHAALDVQGVSTEFAKKLLGSGFYNLFGIDSVMPGLENAEAFKKHFIDVSAQTVLDAIADMETGVLSYSTIDASDFILDKRNLVAKEDIPEIASLRFTPFSGNEMTYIADISCHPTSFGASHGLVSSDYIYYAEKLINETNGANFMMIPGAIGQLSRQIEFDTTGLSEHELKGIASKTLGEAFAELILEADYSIALAPVLNAKHKELFIKPENSILTLACNINLVINRFFLDGKIFKEGYMATELGYIEFGNKVGFALFPGELYPEVFFGNEITNFTNWDGTKWQFDSLANSVEGVDVHCISLANDAIGYVLTDNNFAFFGHIIGDSIADELLSVGKHIGSQLVTEYYSLLDTIK